MSTATRRIMHAQFEPLLYQMLATPAEAAGWRLESFRLLGDETRAMFERNGARVLFTLSSPDGPEPQSAKRTEKFFFAVSSTSRDPAVRQLVLSTLHSVREHEASFSWDIPGDPKLAAFKAEAPAPVAPKHPEEENLWECMREVDHQLDLIPYIDLNVAFDHQACLEESLALVERFRQHCSGIGGELAKGWKSIALRARAGELYRTHDAARMPETGNPEGCEFTPISKECPKLLSFLDTLFDLEKTTTLRLMLLEGGGRVSVHTDGPDSRVVHSVNVALNMPEGCDWVIDCARDGQWTPYTQRAPFRNGSALLVNVAKYHYVENRSDTPRLHVKCEGPLRMNHAGLMRLARRQNGLHSAPEALKALLAKYKRLGEPISANKALVEDAVRFGVLLPGTTELAA